MDTFLRKIRFVPKMLGLMGLMFLFPLLLLIAFPSEARFAPCFWGTALCALLCGALLQIVYLVAPRKRRSSRQKAAVTVMLFWLFMMALGALPFILGGQLRPVQALFESVSGWTTTGFTCYADFSLVPRIFLFYRGFMQLCGGLGFVLLLLLFAGGREAMGLFSAEHHEMIEPSLISTARAITGIYAGMVAVGMGIYCLLGMPWFEAAIHAMGALATGGATPLQDNLAHYDSPAIEAVTIVLMLLGATNFAALALMFRGKWRNFIRVGEIRFFFLLLGGSVLVLSLLGMGIYAGFGESLRYSVFGAVAAVTTTGYAICDINQWKPGMTFLTIILMFIGGASGSTAGGIKYTRVYILWKSFVLHIREKFRPERSVNVLTVQGVSGKQRLNASALLQHHRVALVYLVTFVLGVFLLTLDGIPIEDALHEFACAINNIGLTRGFTGKDANAYVLTVQMCGMILARMEVYIVYVCIAAGLKGAFEAAVRLRKKR